MKRVFLTGASSGIGLEIARALSDGGCEVWGTSRDPGRLPHLPRFHPVTMDLLHRGQIEKEFAGALNDSGGFDVLINNAGAGYFAPFENISSKVLSDQFELLVLAPCELMRLALPDMKRRNAGRILNISSLAAQFPIPFMSAYSAAKAALSAMSDALRLELRGTKIQITDIQPGDFQTSFNEALPPTTWTQSTQPASNASAVWKRMDKEMKRAPSPQIVARSVQRLIDMKSPPKRVVLGNLVQARLAPWAHRIAPGLTERSLRTYYKLP